MPPKKYMKYDSTLGHPTHEAAVDTSAGAGDAGKIGALDANGKWSATMMPTGFGDEVVSINPVTAAGVANQYFTVEGLVTVVQLGPTATVAAAHQAFANAAFVSKTAGAEVVANVPTTAPWFITLSATASAGVYTVRHVTLEAA